MKWVTVFSFSLAVLLFLIGFASALCNENQTIMRLSSYGNAHGALWNELDYGVKICYNDLFSTDYSGDNPHSDNIVLKLSAAINGHAAERSSTAYLISVLYKGLSDCEIRSDGGCPNSTGKAAIVYVSGTTNAHLSKWPAVGYSAVCCKGEEGGIIPPKLQPIACYEFLDRETCETPNNNVIIAQGDPSCKEPDHKCLCVWDDASNKCMVTWARNITIGDCTYTCTTETKEATECNGQSKILSINAKMVPDKTSCATYTDPNCKSGSATVPCGSLEANLPFFGAWQLLASMISIAFIYALFARRNLI